MSIEQALLSYARPQMLAEKCRALVQAEASKGCLPQIAPQPVCLEPVFQPILAARELLPGGPQLWHFLPPISADQLLRFQIWISPDQTCDWKRAERFLKQSASIVHYAGLEIIGNQHGIRVQILCHIADAAIIHNAFRAEFEHCELSIAPFELIPEVEAWSMIAFRDYHPAPPYSHLLTRPDELHTSLYSPIIQALAGIPAPAMGVYQAVFAPVAADHDWSRNVQALLDLEFNIKLLGGMYIPQRYAQQAPSGDLRQMAMDVESKAHSDKPFFAAALRVAIVGDHRARDLLNALTTFQSLIQHGGRPLRHVTQEEYVATLGPDLIREMFTFGLAYRPGFLVNSWELTSLVHVPPIKLAAPRTLPLPKLETLPPNASISMGTPLGTCFWAGQELPVCIPPTLRASHVHLIGRTRTGKSTTMEHMILDDIAQGHGVAVLDPHGRLVERLLDLIPKEHAERVIYADPGDPDHVLLWNPLSRPLGKSVHHSRVADDIVTAFKSFMSGWGDRLEHLLRMAIEGVMQLPQGNLLDVSILLRRHSQESQTLRRQIRELVDNEVARMFWREDFDQYTKADLTPPQHKLSKLLLSGSVGLMLSQPHSAFQFQEIMDSGRILLVNLSTVGSGAREILGCFTLSLLHLTALSRSDTPEADRRPFDIYVDEAHRFITDALDDLIAETCKFAVSLTLAHQFMSQFGTRKTDALSSVGSTVIFKLDQRDAKYLTKDLLGKADADDISRLGLGQAIVRIDAEVARVRTYAPLQKRADSCREQIIAHSHRHYYAPIETVRELVRNRRERWTAMFPVPLPTGDEEEFVYDEF